jgi:hypothetical protein
MAHEQEELQGRAATEQRPAQPVPSGFLECVTQKHEKRKTQEGVSSVSIEPVAQDRSDACHEREAE